MLEKILPYEQNLFFLINGNHHPGIDPVMWLISNTILLIPFFVFILLWRNHKKNWKLWLPIVLGFAFVFLLGDLFSSTLIKPNIQRFRPSHYPGVQEHVRLLYGYTGKLYGFLSGHATNSMAFATFTALIFRKRNYTLGIYFWVILVCYSRVYLGVHFISDIIAGLFLGFFVGFTVYQLYQFYVNKVQRNTLKSGIKQVINGVIIVLFIVLTLIALTTEGII